VKYPQISLALPFSQLISSLVYQIFFNQEIKSLNFSVEFDMARFYCYLNKYDKIKPNDQG